MNKIISGAQTGADLGGLIAAKLHDIPTGGWMTKGFRTQNGPRPDYVDMFNIQEHASVSYKDRTWNNIADSDGTIRFACDFTSAGEKCTLNGIKAYNKPYLDIAIDKDSPTILDWQVIKFHNWVNDNKIMVLNVAGNSHRTWAGMKFYTTTFLSHCLLELGYKRIIYPKEYL